MLFAFRETAVSVLEVDDAYNRYTQKAIILEKKTWTFTRRSGVQTNLKTKTQRQSVVSQCGLKLGEIY